MVRKLRRGSKSRIRRKIRKYKKLLEEDKITFKEVEQSFKSWKAHASHGNCYYLIKSTEQYYNKNIKKGEKNGTKTNQPAGWGKSQGQPFKI
ncbi:MAG: hypothetical protein KH972_07465 [Peptostreptococcaceae bacterium]|nr:hypothetical protein [Peptostreptococcaceae bacterium]